MASSQSRLIDKDQRSRTRPMRVLALGLHRTGTSSLRDALIMLGYNPYHYSELLFDARRGMPLWTEAINAKYHANDEIEPYGRAEFDKLLGDYDAIEDNPGILFAEELIAAYPDAKVILTTRDVDAWIRSMRATILDPSRKSAFFRIARILSPGLRRFLAFGDLVKRTWYGWDPDDERLREVFVGHEERVRGLVPGREREGRLLVMRVGDGQGWEDLCAFLGCMVPVGVPWPHSNYSGRFTGNTGLLRREVGRSLAAAGLLFVVAGWVVWKGSAVYRSGEVEFVSVVMMLVALCGSFLAFRYTWDKDRSLRKWRQLNPRPLPLSPRDKVRKET